MKIEEITNNLSNTIKNLDDNDFIFKFIESFNFPKSTISRLKKGDRNSSDKDGELILQSIKKVKKHNLII